VFWFEPFETLKHGWALSVQQPLQFVVLIIAGCSIAHAADLAVLRNGNSIRHERRQIVGSVTRLYLSDTASGYIEIPTDQIEKFERDTAPPPVKPQLPATRSVQTPRPAAVATLPTTSPVLDRTSLDKVVNGAGQRHQIDPDFISSVIRAESAFNSRAVSKKGAQGLMQLMPQTASQLGVANSFDPNANVEGGTKYLRELLEKYNFDVAKALAAYNAGPHRVEQYRGVPPYYETRAYIARIIRDFNRRKLAENPALAAKKRPSIPPRQTTEHKNASPSPSQAGVRAAR
jgi:Transglycosylase SLT domain